MILPITPSPGARIRFQERGFFDSDKQAFNLFSDYLKIHTFNNNPSLHRIHQLVNFTIGLGKMTDERTLAAFRHGPARL